MAGKRVVVLGGGFGGPAAAIKARSLLDVDHEVTLIDRNRRTFLCGANPLLVVGRRESEKASRSLGLLRNRGVDFVQTEVRSLDLSGRAVETAEGWRPFDYLVISTGAEYDWSVIPGSDRAYSFYNIDMARRLRRRLSAFKRGRIVIGIHSLPYKCPPAPFEAAMILDWHFRNQGIRGDIEIELATPEPASMPVAGPDASARISRAFSRKRIDLRVNAGIREIARSGREVGFTSGQATDANLVIAVPPHAPSALVRESELIGPTGWIQVNPRTLETDVPGVYAIGDVNSVPIANGRGVPKAGVFASAEGETVGRNIAAAIQGSEPADFPGVGHCFIAFSGETSAAITGSFMASGKPEVKLTAPTARGMRSKERFERDWRRFRI